MQISYLNTYWDVVRFAIYHNIRLWLNQLIVLIFTLYTGYNFWTSDWNHKYAFWANCIAFIIMLVLQLAGLALIVLLVIMLSVSLRKNASYHRNRKVTLTENGVDDESPVDHSSISWGAVRRIIQTASFIAIYVSENAAHIIPKRAFDSPNTAREFYDYANTHWKANRESKGV